MLKQSYHLIETPPRFKIGNVYVSDDGTSHTVDQPNMNTSVLMLFSHNKKPVIEANAYILNCQIAPDGTKNIKSICLHLLHYFQYLASNSLKWDDLSNQSQYSPIFLYRSYLSAQIDSGKTSLTTATVALSVVRRFYIFCHQCRYIATLPFNVFGVTKKGQKLTDCTLQGKNKKEVRLQPLNDLDIQYIRDNWRCSGLSQEFRLMISVAMTTGLRISEVLNLKPKHFIIPDGFTENTLTGIWIGLEHGCRTKYNINRQISMPVWLMNAVNQYHKSDRYFKRAQSYFKNTGFIDCPAFVNHHGNEFTAMSINTLWNKLKDSVQENSDPRFNHRLRDCRETFGIYKMINLLKQKKMMAAQGVELLKNEMGHKYLDTTMHYLTYYESGKVLNPIPEITFSDFV